MSRAEQMTRIIRNLSTTTPDIEAAAVVDNDGLMMASSLPQDVEDDAVAAMSAALLGMSERIVSELGRGQFELNMIRGDKGFTILTRAATMLRRAVRAQPENRLARQNLRRVVELSAMTP